MAVKRTKLISFNFSGSHTRKQLHCNIISEDRFSEASPMTDIEKRLEELSITLPAPPSALGTYVGAVTTGNLVFISGAARETAA